ncbi:MAG: AAA family ATPase, partial [Chloroflexota bacterium]|nr:AAA family ATPase [Chloroflexota bacterium]
MLTHLQIQNFKSWRDTGQMRFAPLTGFFGPNSSGKTSLLQFLLLLKQTIESPDRRQVLNLGTERSYVTLSTFEDLVFRHQDAEKITFTFEFKFTSNKSVSSFAPAISLLDQKDNLEF